MKNNHTSTWHVIMSVLSDIITISFSLYLKWNVTYKYTTNVHTLQTRTTLSKCFNVPKHQTWHFFGAWQQLALKILPNAFKMATAGQRVDTSFSSHYNLFAKSGWERRPGQVRGLWSAFPHLGFGVPCWCGVGGPWLGGLLVHALGKYLDPVKKWICVALRTRHMGY